MAITHVTLPAGLEIRASQFQLVGATQLSRSPLSGATQMSHTGAARWVAHYETPALPEAQARAWRAFLASLRGRAVPFYGHDPSFRSFAGIAGWDGGVSTLTFDSTAVKWDNTSNTWDDSGPITSPGSPYVRLPDQTGTIVRTAGWVPGLVIYAGEYIAFDFTDANSNTLRALHIVKTSVTVGDTGAVNLTVEPPVRTAPANGATIYVSNPACSMRLVADDSAKWQTDVGVFTSFSLDAEQIWTAEETT